MIINGAYAIAVLLIVLHQSVALSVEKKLLSRILRGNYFSVEIDDECIYEYACGDGFECLNLEKLLIVQNALAETVITKVAVIVILGMTSILNGARTKSWFIALIIANLKR